eukprot:TRINITY_DN9466_c0_g1_i1.p2 TRINITY_DN9466_c0_g1~~TRINITY_DN9466_c0_g1_i1.p2  ORF type:complete len:138 (+),score=24.12 TRINITY_DN9466_c0_g1_i1:500-913(+)
MAEEESKRAVEITQLEFENVYGLMTDLIRAVFTPTEIEDYQSSYDSTLQMLLHTTKKSAAELAEAAEGEARVVCTGHESIEYFETVKKYEDHVNESHPRREGSHVRFAPDLGISYKDGTIFDNDRLLDNMFNHLRVH